MNWSFDAIADVIAEILGARERELTEEQAVRGLDSLDEVELHPLLARGLLGAGWGVLREQPYPDEWTRKLGPSIDTRTGEVLPQARDRQRCDLVLTPAPDQLLDDALTDLRERQRRLARTSGTLFEAVALAAEHAEAQARRPGAVTPEEAFWLEVKVVRQFDTSSGVPGPNRSYAGELVRGVTSDLSKLAADSRVACGALALVMFAESPHVARHDAALALHKALDRDLPVQSPVVRELRICDRLGNRCCVSHVIGVRAAREE